MRTKKCIVMFSVFTVVILYFHLISTANEFIGEDNKIEVSYSTHIQDYGWEPELSKLNGETSGTEGKSKRLEAIKIDAKNISENAKIKYQVHIQDIGWQEWKENGQTAGTEGKAKRLEAIKIKLENEEKYSVKYRVHVQDIGWQKWKKDGAMAGTEGQSKRLEAIQIIIVDRETNASLVIEKGIEDKSYYKEIPISGYKTSNMKDTNLKVMIDDKDFTDDLNINFSGRNDIINKIDCGGEEENQNPGFKFNINAKILDEGKHILKIIVYDKNYEKELTSYTKEFIVDKNIHIEYKSHIQNVGWQNEVNDGDVSGTMKKGLRLEAISLNGINLPDGITLRYKVHVQDIGWQDWVNDGEIAGTEGQNKRLEAIKVELENSEKYSVKYRVHVQDIGWQDWVNDGETAGTEEQAKRLEAIQIQIVDKIRTKKTMICLDDMGQVTNEVHQLSGWIMTNEKNTKIKLFIDNEEINNQLTRKRDQGVYNQIKGYGGEELNPEPRFITNIDFSKYSLGNHIIKMQAISEDGNIIKETSININVVKKIESYKGQYGITGLGDSLEYFRYGNGPNVFFATFCVHGFEDNWSRDGYALVDIAHQFYNRLNAINDYSIADKWTIYIMQCVNPDGVNQGNTNYGPGRTTLRSDVGHGIDLNRCWSTAFVANYTNRNYTGSQPFLAQESRYLRDFMLAHRSTTGQNVVVDLHGWTQQLIGDPILRNYYRTQFPENTDTATYGKGYLINWARTNIGARAALIELPRNNYSDADVRNHNLVNRYIEATLSMLRGI